MEFHVLSLALLFYFSCPPLNYRIVANASPSRFEAHAGLFRLLMKGIFDAYVCIVIFWQKNTFELVTRVSNHNSTVLKAYFFLSDKLLLFYKYLRLTFVSNLPFILKMFKTDIIKWA